MKLRVLHLARDLDITARQVHEFAAELGIPLPDSALAGERAAAFSEEEAGLENYRHAGCRPSAKQVALPAMR